MLCHIYKLLIYYFISKLKYYKNTSNAKIICWNQNYAERVLKYIHISFFITYKLYPYNLILDIDFCFFFLYTRYVDERGGAARIKFKYFLEKVEYTPDETKPRDEYLRR